jgi:hypothetical protein
MRILAALALTFLALAPAAAATETPEERQACTDDAYNFCGHEIPDRDRVAACLSRNLRRISAACRTVMLRHAKPAAEPAARTSTGKE